MTKENKTEAVTTVEQPLPPMNSEEITVLRECEETIRRGLTDFMDVGVALARIRGGKLYRTTHKTFEEYCQVKWSMDRVYASRLIRGSELAKQLNPPPKNEYQIRNLLSDKITPERAQAVWKQANEAARKENRPLKAADVAQIVGKARPASGGPAKSIVKVDLMEWVVKASKDKAFATPECSALLQKLKGFIQRY